MMGATRLWVPLCLATAPLFAQQPDAAFFESKIRPVLVEKCSGCHSSKLKAPMSGLVVDTKAGLAKGGSMGAEIVPGKPAESRLLTALKYTDTNLQMPPTGKLPDAVIADFEEWIKMGAPDPRIDAPAATSGAPVPAPLKGMSIADGKKWWAFQPVQEMKAPKVKNAAWPKNKIDNFVLAQLEHAKLPPSKEALPRELVERLYVDLVGYKPDYEEIAAYLGDKSPKAYEALVDKLLASTHYGERWGRHWMDVARYGEDNYTGEATTPGYPTAWKYRDWIIDALNKDMPYDYFVKMQLAADELPGAKPEDYHALGYLGAAPIYHKDQRLSYDVIYGFLTDDWDERVDAVSRGLLGMTVGCARCHDHKFDPIPTKDYYSMAGMFASTMRAERPDFPVDKQTLDRFLWMQRRLFDLRYSADLLTNEASTVVGAAERVAKWKAEIESLHQEAETWRQEYPDLPKHLERYWTFPPPRVPGQPAPGGGGRRGGMNPEASAPFFSSVYDAAQYPDNSDAHYTMINYKAGEARNLPVMAHGSVTALGAIEPRHFLTVLSKSDDKFTIGSGRFEFAEKMFTDGAPLTARVIVNRVWAWHFGKGIVATPSDFGVQGEKPTHPELLDDLAARFIAHGWSLKWLNREIVTSAAYRQSSHSRPDGEEQDVTNALLWRMNPRRVDVEVYRDSMLRAAGKLMDDMHGPSQDLDSAVNVKRTVYGRVSRSRLNGLLVNYDFPSPILTSSGRDLTTTSLQQLFLMNSTFVHGLAAALAKSVEDEPDAAAKTKALYRKILSRDPNAKEIELAAEYLSRTPDPDSKQTLLEQYAQILLSTNEEIFWP